MKETDIAKPLIRWLAAQGWEVYQEVQIEAYGRVADVVAVRRKIVWALEMKKSLTAALVEQAYHWVWLAHYVSVVTPSSYRRAPGRAVLLDYMKTQGIGWVKARLGSYDSGRYFDVVHEEQNARLHRKARASRILDALTEEHKTFAEAGNNDGKRWTPFQETAKQVRKYVKRFPGTDLKQLVENVAHHYSTAASFKCNIPKYVEANVIEGVRIEREGRKLHFYPDEAANA